MSKALELTNRRFGKLTVLNIYRNGGKGRGIEWNCRCDCGQLVTAAASELKSGSRKMCRECVSLKRRCQYIRNCYPTSFEMEDL